MSLPNTKEIAAVRQLLECGALTSRTALLITLLGCDTASRQMGPLAESLGLSIPRVSMLGDTLVKLGLADRCIPANDLRKTALALTRDGYQVARQHLGMLRTFSACAAEPVSATPPSTAVEA